jgi:hypothetical protein
MGQPASPIGHDFYLRIQQGSQIADVALPNAT